MPYAYRNRTVPPNSIIIHHTGGSTKNGALSTLIQKGLSYNYIIDSNGSYETLVSSDKVAFHCGNRNNDTVGIALVGDFTKTKPTTEQKETLKYLINTLLSKHKTIKNVLKHSDVSSTTCPAFDISEFKELLNAKQNVKHWCDDDYNFLLSKGLNISDKRFDENVTRGEMFSMIARTIKTLGL